MTFDTFQCHVKNTTFNTSTVVSITLLKFLLKIVKLSIKIYPYCYFFKGRSQFWGKRGVLLSSIAWFSNVNFWWTILSQQFFFFFFQTIKGICSLPPSPLLNLELLLAIKPSIAIKYWLTLLPFSSGPITTRLI